MKKKNRVPDSNDGDAPLVLKPYPTTGFRLAPKKAKNFLAPNEVVKRIRNEFLFADVDPKAGVEYVGEMIRALVRSRQQVPPEDAAELERAISRYKEIRKEAIFVSFGDDPKAGQSEKSGYGYVNVLVLPEEPMRVGYCSAEHERDASPLVKRFVSVLQYVATPER